MADMNPTREILTCAGMKSLIKLMDLWSILKKNIVLISSRVLCFFCHSQLHLPSNSNQTNSYENVKSLNFGKLQHLGFPLKRSIFNNHTHILKDHGLVFMAL